MQKQKSEHYKFLPKLNLYHHQYRLQTQTVASVLTTDELAFACSGVSWWSAWRALLAW